MGVPAPAGRLLGSDRQSGIAEAIHPVLAFFPIVTISAQ